jgi:WD40 repeat protein
VATGRNTATLRGHTASICYLAFSPDGKTLAVADRTVQRWDVARRERIDPIKDPTYDTWSESIDCLAFRPDGKALAYGWDRAIKIWDLGSGQTSTFQEDPQAQVNNPGGGR